MVYFIVRETDGLVKIGFSHNPLKRLVQLQRGMPDRLRIHAACPGPMRTEKALHELFRDDRIGGEWFSPTPRLVALMNSIRERPELGLVVADLHRIYKPAPVIVQPAPQKRKRNLSPETRERLRQLALDRVARGEIGGAKFGKLGGRPRTRD